MKRDPLFSALLESAKKNFSGWDFSFISETGRINSEPLSWSYTVALLSSLCNMQNQC